MYITGHAMGVRGTAKRNVRKVNVASNVRANLKAPRIDAVDAACLAIASAMLTLSVVAGVMFGIAI